MVIGRHVEALAFLDVILGDKPPLEPHETFYQRALEGKALALTTSARKRIGASSFADYFDKVALPGLALAQGDLARDDAAFERLDAIHLQIEDLLNKLYGDRPVRPDGGDETKGRLSNEWSGDEAIALIPGRGQLDDLAASMAVHALQEAGFGARTCPNSVLGGGTHRISSFASTKLCCLSIIEEGSTGAAIRYFGATCPEADAGGQDRYRLVACRSRKRVALDLARRGGRRARRAVDRRTAGVLSGAGGARKEAAKGITIRPARQQDFAFNARAAKDDARREGRDRPRPSPFSAFQRRRRRDRRSRARREAPFHRLRHHRQLRAPRGGTSSPLHAAIRRVCEVQRWNAGPRHSLSSAARSSSGSRAAASWKTRPRFWVAAKR